MKKIVVKKLVLSKAFFMRSIVNLLHEIGMLSHILRSGFAFLGAGKQSVAEHSFRVALIAHTLTKFCPEPINHDKLIMMCLLHDLPESRIGDLNYVQKKYVKVNLEKALEDISQGSPLGPEIVNWIQEYEQGESVESQLAHDADQIELILVLKQEYDRGSHHALDWFDNVYKRLKTSFAKELAHTILDTPANEWWLAN